MKCVIENNHLGIWCRAIHSLTQVGDGDIYFDFSETILTVSATNMSHSTFATFLFFRQFFGSYQMIGEESEKVVIPSRIILKPYKSQKVAKSYLSSKISYDPSQDFVIVKGEARSHATSEYKLRASSNTEEITLDVDPYSFKNCMKIDAKTLSRCLSNFSHVKGLAELTLKIDGNKVMLRNTVTDIARKDSVVTEYSLTSHDFAEFDVEDENVEFSFGFKEFKVFISLAEHLKLPVCIHFEEGEQPIIVVVVKTDTFESRLCLTTKMKDPFSNSMPISATPPSSSNGRISNATSQSSSASTRNPTHEVNRNRGREAVDVVDHREAPPAKRCRRTDAPAPPEEPVIVMELDEDVPAPSPQGPTPSSSESIVQIAAVVETMERQKKSAAYRSIQRVMNAPVITEEEYLNSIPDHAIVLCPASDDES